MSDSPGGQEAGYQIECRGQWCCFLTESKLTMVGNGILHMVRMSLVGLILHFSRFRENHMVTETCSLTLITFGKIT